MVRARRIRVLLASVAAAALSAAPASLTLATGGSTVLTPTLRP